MFVEEAGTAGVGVLRIVHLEERGANDKIVLVVNLGESK